MSAQLPSKSDERVVVQIQCWQSGLSHRPAAAANRIHLKMPATRNVARQRTYWSWINMKRRCDNPTAVGYDRYGGSGISYCRRWEKFDNFVADMGMRPSGLTLERNNNSRNYMPSNCRWATHLEQT